MHEEKSGEYEETVRMESDESYMQLKDEMNTQNPATPPRSSELWRFESVDR